MRNSSRNKVVLAVVAAVAVVVGIFVVAGAAGLLGGGGSSGSGASLGVADYAAPQPAAAPSAAAGIDAQGNTADGEDLGKVAATTADRDVVRTASIAVTADNPSAAADRAGSIATAAGGRVDDDTRGATAHVVLRVPADRLDATLDQLAALGTQTSRDVKGDDVTAQTADVGARVQALETSVARLRTLIGTSGSLSDLLAVETQLTARQAELESLQAQQRALADQVSLATVTLDLVAPAAAAAADSGPTGFGGAVAGGWHGFTLAVRYLLAGLGYTLPFLVLAAVALGAVVLVRRRRSRRTPLPVSGDFSP